MTRSTLAPRVAAIMLAALVAGADTASGADEGEPSLTGTYRLDAYDSDDPSEALDAALGGMSDEQRAKVRSRILPRLTPPGLLVIEQQGRSILVGSPLAAKTLFEADGEVRAESGLDGSTRRVRAVLSDSGFNVTVERGGDVFNSQFGLFDGGRRLAVEYEAFVGEIGEPVVVQSVYTRTSSAPDWPTDSRVSSVPEWLETYRLATARK